MSSCWGPTSMGFTRFRVKACGLKTPDTQNRDTKDMDRDTEQNQTGKTIQ